MAAWLLARVPNGRFLIRIEDLDTARVSAAGNAAGQQLADLAAIGLDWEPDVVVQSKRIALYEEAISFLGDRVYPCFCTRREIAAAASAPHDTMRAYPGTCATLSSAQRTERALTRTPALRVRAEAATFEITDLHAGKVSAVVDDFVLRRNDGTPAYNLAVVVDDGLQGVTQVTRGDDLLASAPRQGWLADHLGYAVPEYAHVSLVIGPTGARLAKRDGAVTLTEFEASHGESAFNWARESLGLPRADSPASLLGLLPADFAGTPSWWTPVTFAG